MPRINQLPAASSVASTDVVAIDTQDKTYRVPKSTLFDGYYTAVEVDEAVAQSTAVVSTTLSSSGHPNIDTTKPFNVSVVKTGKTCFARIFSVVPATSASGWSDIITLPSGYTPNWDMNIVLYDDTAGKAVEARMYSDNGTLRIYAPVAGHSYWGTAVYVTA